jgi:serine/threonine-protein kinase
MRICSAPLPVPSKFGPASEAFDAWFAKAMDRNPERRFQSAKEMAEALAAIVPTGAARRTVKSDLFRENAQGALWSGDKTGEPNRKSLALIAVVAALSTVAIVSATLWLFSKNSEQPTPSPGGSPGGSPSAMSPVSKPESSPTSSAVLPSPSVTPEVAPTGSPSPAPTQSAAPPTSAPTFQGAPPASPKPPKPGGRAEDIFGI